ncbi:MAG: hypothetical protein ACJAZ3_001201 [Sphingobacteriales bacterium]|jgi:hypothetical protein
MEAAGIRLMPHLKNTEAIAGAFTNMGYATWNIEYRTYDLEGGGWPETFNDVTNATDFIFKTH